MASIFKRTRDKGKRGKSYYINITDEDGKRKMVKGFTDRGETEQLAAKLEHEVLLCKRGLIDPKDKRQAEQKNLPIEIHLKAFEKALGGNTTKHVTMTVSRVRKVVSGIEAKTIADLNSDAVRDFMDEWQAEDDFGPRTYNHYLQAFDQFGTWLVQTKRLNSNPVVGVPRQNAEVDVRHPRRALTPDEFRQLLQSALASDEEIQCYDGQTRARIYLISYFTGLRRGEIASLTAESFQLAGPEPTLTVEAAFSKHRRRDVLPLHAELIEVLATWLKQFSPGQPLFPHLAKRRTWKMVKLDLQRVGIAYVTKEGIADFHAAGRHTYVTQLLRHGASLPEVMKLARHCDVKMTMRYSHIGLADQARALRALPSPRTSAKTELHSSESADEKKTWPRPDTAPDGSTCPSESSSVTSGVLAEPTKNPCRGKGYRRKSASDAACQKWRRRESNPRPAIDPRPLLRV